MKSAPSDSTIESALRAAVHKARDSGELEEITVKTARTSAEELLGLEVGWFKSHGTWKYRSKDFITREVNSITPQTSGTSPERSSPEKARSDEPPRKKRRVNRNPVSGARLESNSAEPGSPAANSVVDAAGSNGDTQESDISVLADEPAKPAKHGAKQRKASGSSKPLSKASKSRTSSSTATSRSKKSAAQGVSPEEAEVKRLQSELLKCGVRKFWAKELAPFEESKAKIAHLKSMLRDIGMTGRFSMDKARAIKERRELEADVTALTGRDRDRIEPSESDRDGKEDSPPVAEKRRRVAARFVDFGDNDEED